MRGNDHLTVGLVVQNSLRNRLAIVSTVTDKALKGVTIGASKSAAAEGSPTSDLLVLVNCKMEFSIEIFYNRQCAQEQRLDYLSPAAFTQRFHLNKIAA